MIPWGRRLSLSSKQIISFRQVMCSSPTSYCCYFLIFIASRQSSRELLLSNFYYCFAKHYSFVLHQMHVDLKDPDLNTPGSTTHAAPTLTPGRGGDWPPSHSVKLRGSYEPPLPESCSRNTADCWVHEAQRKRTERIDDKFTRVDELLYFQI